MSHTGSAHAAELLGGQSQVEAHTRTLMLGMSSSLESLVRLSIRLFQSRRSTVLWVGSQLCAYGRVSTSSHPISKQAASGTLTQLVTPLCFESPWLPQQVSDDFWGPPPCCCLSAQGCGRAQIPQHQSPHSTLQAVDNLPTLTHVLACEPVLALRLGCDAELGQGFLPPKGASRHSQTPPEVSQCSRTLPAAHP